MTRSCASCAFENGDGVFFCGGCGAQLPVACVACQFDNPPGHKFCGSCGEKLVARTSTTPSASQPALARDGVGERRQITVLFCDIVGSTELSERVDPEELRELVRSYQQTSANAIERAGGHVAQYLGDGILAYFGYPTAHEDDARRAVHAGLAIVAAVQDLNDDTLKRKDIAIAVRCAIHTGPVVAGDVGATGSGARLAVGSTPNLAAHLQGVAPVNGVVLSAATRDLVQGWFELDSLGLKNVKGRKVPMEVFQAVREAASRSRSELDAARHLSPLVGRAEELALLTRALEAARGGVGQLVLLSGEAGVGKSRLVQLTRQRATNEGFVCLTVRCASYFTSSPMHPIIEMLADDLGFIREDSPAVKLRKLERNLEALGASVQEHVPPLAQLLGIPAGESYPAIDIAAQKQKERAFASLLALFALIAERRTLALVVEDLHWADPSTQEFLGQLAGQPPIPRMLTLMTTRTDAGIPWATHSSITRLTLSRLTDGEVRTMIDQLAGAHHLPTGVVSELVKKTDGVPVFVEELTKMVLEEALHTSGTQSLSESSFALAIPATLRDSLLARLDRMDDAKEIAQLGAALGREFSYSLVAAASGSSEVSLRARLDRLVNADVLYQRGIPPDATYTFKHALIQDAAYDLLLKSTRRQFHGRIADALGNGMDRGTAPAPEILAHHLTEAGLTDRAIGAWLQAGMRSLQRSANMEAIGQLQRGLDLLPDLGDSPARLPLEVGLLSAMGPAIMATRGFAAPMLPPLYERLNALCAQLGEVPEMIWAARGVWVYYHVRADLDAALDLSERCMRLAERSQVTEVLMESLYTVACTHHFRGEFAQARPDFERLIALDSPSRDHSTTMYTAMDVVTTAHSLFSHTLWALGEKERAFEHARRGLEVSTSLGHSLSQAFALYHLTCLHVFNGDREAVKENAAALLRISEERGLFFIAQGLLLAGWAADDEDTVQRGLQAHYGSGSLVGQTCALYLLADVQRRRKRFDAALEAIGSALAAAETTRERWWNAELQRLRADVLIDQGRTTAEIALALDDALATASTQQAAAFAARISDTRSRFDSLTHS